MPAVLRCATAAASLLLLTAASAAAASSAAASGAAASSTAPKPHVVFLLVDDYGWANAGWHNDVESSGQREVQTPNMDRLVAEGIELNQHYTFKFCSPTRSSLQSGRNPIHVNVQNVGPDRANPADPVAGFSAIARNMTGMAVHMKAAGWATAAVGKWDAGMATTDHTPEGRGYDQSLIYFHHANDYWQYTCGGCDGGTVGIRDVSGGPETYTDQERLELNLPARGDEGSRNHVHQPGTCPSTFKIVPEAGICKHAAHDIWHGPVANQEACCAKCADQAGCVGWTHQYHDPESNRSTSTCFTCNSTAGCDPRRPATACSISRSFSEARRLEQRPDPGAYLWLPRRGL